MVKAKGPVPEGYNSITPYLIVKDAAAAIKFYSQVFGATLKECHDGPGGKVFHAELKIGTSYIMLADEFPESGILAPKTTDPTPLKLLLYIADVDHVFKTGIEKGATSVTPIKDQFYGDRSGTFRDPFGYVWTVATHMETLTPEEIAARMPKYS